MPKLYRQLLITLNFIPIRLPMKILKRSHSKIIILYEVKFNKVVYKYNYLQILLIVHFLTGRINFLYLLFHLHSVKMNLNKYCGYKAISFIDLNTILVCVQCTCPSARRSYYNQRATCFGLAKNKTK